MTAHGSWPFGLRIERQIDGDRSTGSPETRARVEERVRFVSVFGMAALQAAHVARRLQGNVPSWTKAGDTPESAALTMADLTSQDVLLEPLRAAFPQVAVDAEEETELAGAFPPEAPGRPLIIVDPIDGTFNYAHGSADFAVMGAWLDGGHYQAAVVALPTANLLYWAIRGAGCWCLRVGMQPERVAITAPPQRVFLTPRTPRAWHERLRRAGWEPETSRCSAIDSAAPALGAACAALSSHGADRRRAIPLLLTLEAGGTVLAGTTSWNREDPGGARPSSGTLVVAATSDLAQRIARAVC